MAAAQQFIRELAASRPDLAPSLGELGELHERKLYHELTVKLEEVVSAPAFCAPGDDALVALYTRFVSDFEAKVNQLKLAHIAVAVSARLGDPGVAVAFLEAAAAKLQGDPKAAAPSLYLRMHVALLHLQAGNLAACKAGVEQGRGEVEGLEGAGGTSVQAAFYFVAAQLAKANQDFAEFYKTGLLYLAYTSLEAVPQALKLELAVDLSLAALLGENIFNFGELLGHSVLQALQGSGYEWLAELLAVFNAGDLPGYSAFCTKHAAVLNAQPALVAAERLLQEKITIVALTEIVFGLPAEQRTIPLEVIAAKTRLSLDGVERLLMRTLSVHLIEGTIDHVAGTVRITWVQPRVLLPPQIAELRTRLDGWIDKVHAARVELEAATDLIGTA